MDALQIKSIVEQALRDPQNFPLRVYIIICLITGVSAFFGAYCIRLGQVFAERKQAEHLQRLDQAHQQVIELMSQKHQLRLAALDSRLKAHQEAFTLWQELDRKKATEEINNIIIKCQQWWNNNCLYLDAQARLAFIEAVHAARGHDNLLRCVVSGNATKEELKQNGNVIRAAGLAIVQGVALPPITSNEAGVV